MNAKQKEIGCAFGFLWVIANVIGWSLGSFISISLYLLLGYGAPYSSTDDPAFLFWFYSYIAISIAISGSIPGICQWLVLRRYVSGISKRWILTCVIGAVPLAWNIGLSFAVMALLQWLILRRRASETHWWLLTSIIIAVIFSSLTISDLSDLTDSPLIVPLLLIVNSAIMGLVLLGLSPQSSHT